ncbi:hypothetical protein [Haloarchaeobius amylolyticus]|uniref:hypothetical protein n=1 Tax=Haloarchaeobius amylolyticus TaxID=1198296 RepID=UPI002271DBFD|nr:hypothetical protein [Haloarchaeobius amylolyticus]
MTAINYSANFVSTPTIDHARQLCRQAVLDAAQVPHPVVVNALPSMGKSWSATSVLSELGVPGTILTSRTDLSEEHIAGCEKEGLTYYQIPSFYRDCPTAGKNNEHGDAWKTKFNRKYNRGRSAKWLHENARTVFGEELPCGPECPYMAQFRDPEEVATVDVIIGNHQHAYVSEYIDGRVVFIDEFPGDAFLKKFDSDEYQQIVSEFLKNEPTLPFENYAQLEAAFYNRSNKAEIKAWRQSSTCLPSQANWHRTEHGHINGLQLTRAALSWDWLENGWRWVDIGGGYTAARHPEDGEIWLASKPDLSTAASVVGLDGTASPVLWRYCLGPETEVIQVLSRNDANVYLRDTLQLRIVQLTDNIEPYLSSYWINPGRDMAVIEYVCNHNQNVGLITSKKARNELLKRGLDGFIPEENVRHYGMVTGTNALAQCDVGLIIGAPQRSDRDIERWCALMGESVKAAQGEDGNRRGGKALDFGPIGNEVSQHFREYDVLQAIMRFSRANGTGSHGATVYVYTGAIPSWVDVERESWRIVPTSSSVGLMQVCKALHELGVDQGESRTTTEIQNSVETLSDDPVKQDQTRKVLKDLAQRGDLQQEKRGKDLCWFDYRVNFVGDHGIVLPR